MRTLICSKFWNTQNYNETTKKVGTKSNDLIAQGYTPNQGGDGVLYHWDDVPLGYYGIPTLNNMIYSKKLWEDIINNPLIKAAVEGNCFWGEADHPDRDEVSIKEVACRVSNMRIEDNNLVLGSIDLMDTPNGLICYSLAKTGRIGNSTRGYGELIASEYPNVKLVNDAEGVYTHVCTDMVALPAVPCATATLASQAGMAAAELGSLEDYLKSLINQAVERNPTQNLLLMQSILNKDDRVKHLLAASRAREERIRSVLTNKR